MTVTVRRLGQASNIAANTRTRVYTVPAGKRAILMGLTQGSDNAGAVRLGITLGSPNVEPGIGGTFNAGFIWDQNVPDSYTSKLWPLATVMHAGDYVDAEHNATNCYTMLQGVELDADREAAQLHRVSFVNVAAATKSWTVPAGKRFRVREVVICNHGINSNVIVYVNNVGYFVRVQAKANEGVVVPTDMAVNPGEIISAGATADPTHVFLSGVLEDA